ncbi:hypothetical protein ACMYSQ_006188 [Aspergillus niger]
MLIIAWVLQGSVQQTTLCSESKMEDCLVDTEGSSKYMLPEWYLGEGNVERLEKSLNTPPPPPLSPDSAGTHHTPHAQLQLLTDRQSSSDITQLHRPKITATKQKGHFRRQGGRQTPNQEGDSEV